MCFFKYMIDRTQFSCHDNASNSLTKEKVYYDCNREHFCVSHKNGLILPDGDGSKDAVEEQTVVETIQRVQ